MTISDNETVKIGCHAGFWGDSLHNVEQLVKTARVDYLVSDYLAETTMSIMAAAKMRDPEAGYAPDVIRSIQPYLGEIRDQSIKVITNAGGLNPDACRAALQAAAAKEGVSFRIATVYGDDLMPRFEEVKAMGPRDLDRGAELPENVTSMNAYIGSPAIARALDEGADIVICGRITDSAVVIGALMHEFGWEQTEYDQLAAAALAGHLVECVQQATGGCFTDWAEVPEWENVGLPVVEFNRDGSFVLTKPEGTGGLVSTATAAEQLLYEMGDPQGYLLPDVVCDFSNVILEQVGENRVRVKGARGLGVTKSYKVSSTYLDGYRLMGTMMVGGRDAEAKARRQADAIIQRITRFIHQAGFGGFEEVSIEVIGAEDTYGENRRTSPAREVILKVGLHHRDKGALEIFSTEFVASVLSMAQGTTGFFAGRPKVSPFIRHFSFLIDKSLVPVEIDIEGKCMAIAVEAGSEINVVDRPAMVCPQVDRSGGTIQVPLIALAWGRSGDKGDSANIGIIAREPEFATIIREQLDADAVLNFFKHYSPGGIDYYEMPGILGFNYIVKGVLGGGGASSLRYDAQGKAYAQMLMDFPMQVPSAWVESKDRIAQFAGEIDG